jgi:hypothetical protein
MIQILLLFGTAIAAGLVDNYCKSLQDNTCTLTGQTILFTSSINVNQASYNLVLVNTTIGCSSKRPTCTIQFDLLNGANLTLEGASEIKAKHLIINGPYSRLTVAEASTISVSGMSDLQIGSSRSYAGASFASFGGQC